MHKISILKRTAFLLILNFANSGMASSLEAIGLGDANNPSYLPSLAGLSADGSTLVGKYNLAQNPEDIFTTAFLFGKDSKIQIFDASECDINPTAISANGSVVVGYWADTDSSNYQAFRWTSAGGLQELGALTEGGFSEAKYVSADGSVVVGDSDAEDGNRYAYRWTQAGGMVSLGALAGGGNSFSYGISADGSVVVGFSDNGDGNQHAFRWTASQGMMNLGVLLGGSYSQATAVSDDGKVVVGISEMGDGNVYAFRWTQEKGMQILGTLEGALGLLPIDISADGSVVIGNTTDGWNNSAFRWTASEGIKSLGTITNELYSSVQGISSDGSVVVGDAADTDGNVYAFRWTSTTGIQPLDTFLTTLGLDVSDWDFAGNAMGNLILVSADGQTISGLGYYSKDGQPALNGFEAIYLVRSAKRATAINSSPIASTITYGQTLASSTLSAGSASVAGRFAWTTPSTVPTAGTSAQNVTFTPNDTANYATRTSTVNVVVAKKVLTGSFTASSKPYDGNNSATVVTRMVNGTVGSDNVYQTGGAATYNSAAVANNKVVTLVGATLAGAAAGNYTLSSVSTTTANITPKVLTIIGAVATTRVYNGLMAVALGGGSLSGVVGADAVTLGGTPAGTMATATAGSAKSVAVTGYSISGASAASYRLLQPTGLTVNITKANTTISVVPTAQAINYGQTLASSSLGGGSATVAGSFNWTTPSTIPTVGTSSQGVTFTPTDAANYNTATTSVSVVANPAITSNLSAVTVALGANYSYQITGSGLPTSFGAIRLPPGLKLNAKTGLISGKPTSVGSFSVTLQAMKKGATTATATKVFTVVQIPTFTYAAKINVQRGKALNLAPKIAGYPAPTFSILTGSLPPGLSLNRSTAAITGKPTTVGTYPFRVRGSNSAGNTDRSVTIVVK
jgi:probable HAF family extracellular repeat protein